MGCFNPESWSFKENKLVNIYELADKIKSHNPAGLTISGGEPFLQPQSLLEFLKYLENPFKNGILIYSGFYEAELKNIPEYSEISNIVDVIVSGRYDQTKRVFNSLLSSINQKFIWNPSSKITEEELQNQNFELISINEGYTLTGFPPFSKDITKDLKELGVDIKGF